MSTVEDFENAPVGAIATHAFGSRAMKVDGVDRRWVIPSGRYVDNESMVNWGYTLDPLEPCPASTREALDLAWELAHEVKPGQVIPKGTRYLEVTQFGLKEYTAQLDIKITPVLVPIVRTVEPLSDPEPEWLDAPAVMARLKTWIPSATPRVFVRYEHDHSYWLTIDPPAHHWSELENVTPLYPKEDT